MYPLGGQDDEQLLSILLTCNNEQNYPESSSTPRKERKRIRNETNWKKNVSKRLRNTGKAYKTSRAKVVGQREIKDTCNDKCRLNCRAKVTMEEREYLFHEYWALGDVKRKWNYISNSMTTIKTKYRYIREGGTGNQRRKKNAFHFNLPNKKIRVCKTFFKNTLDISDRPIRTVMEKQVAGIFLADDNRGKHGNHSKTDESILNGIRAHIDSLPKLEIHCPGASMSKMLVDGSKSITQVHKDYVNQYKKKGIPYGNYDLFYKIFTEEFNISFIKPKKGKV